MRNCLSAIKKSAPYLTLLFCLSLLFFNTMTLFKSKQKVAQTIIRGKSAKILQRDLGSMNMLMKLRNDVDLKGIEKRIPEISFANLERMSDARSVRIFVYNLPPKLNIDWLKHDSPGLCSSSTYSGDFMLHRWLQTSEHHTHDPRKADFFYVPVYGACSFSAVGGSHLYEEALNVIVHKYPYFNETQGKNHIWTFASGGYGLFHGSDKIHRGILLTHRGRARDYIHYKDIVIPPNLEFLANSSLLTTTMHSYTSRKLKKKFFLHFSMYSDYTKESTTVPKHAVSTPLIKKCLSSLQKEANFVSVNSTRQLLQEIPHTTYCVCIEAQADFYDCLTIAILFECVPIIAGQQLGLPFEEAINYGGFSIRFPIYRLCSVRNLVQEITDNVLQSMLNELSRMKKVFMYSRGNAGDVVVRLLAKRRPLVSLHNPYHSNNTQ